MKLNIQTDFTKFPRATSVLRASDRDGSPAAGSVRLAHHERTVRRRALPIDGGEQILLDLAEQTTLASGDRLVLEDGRQVEIAAADEEVLEVRGRDAAHLAELAWHVGERHLALAVGPQRLLLMRDAAAREMLEALGATVKETTAPFEPVKSLHSRDDHAHDHHHHAHDAHGHGERDAHGRLPGDPHYGHNHA